VDHPNQLKNIASSTKTGIQVLSLVFIISCAFVCFTETSLSKHIKFVFLAGIALILLLQYYHHVIHKTLDKLSGTDRLNKHLLSALVRLCEGEPHLDTIIDELANRPKEVIEQVFSRLSEYKKEALVRRVAEKIDEMNKLLKHVEDNPVEWKDNEVVWLDLNKELCHLNRVRQCFG
jgi:hypothetical protein